MCIYIDIEYVLSVYIKPLEAHRAFKKGFKNKYLYLLAWVWRFGCLDEPNIYTSMWS